MQAINNVSKSSKQVDWPDDGNSGKYNGTKLSDAKTTDLCHFCSTDIY
jgi:hypothetical protein